MKLSEKQAIFSKNIASLIIYADMIGIDLTFGEAYRTHSQVLLYYFGYKVVRGGAFGIKLIKSRKLSNTLRGQHPRRLALDFNFFIKGELTYEFEKVKELGEFWLTLHPDNRWGGDFNKNGIKDGFVDTPHFEMQ
jgi:hypothetical protein